MDPVIGKFSDMRQAFTSAVFSHIDYQKQNYQLEPSLTTHTRFSDPAKYGTCIRYLRCAALRQTDTNPYSNGVAWIKGNLVLARNESTPMFICSGTSDGPGEEMNVMQRAAGGGTILGGTYDIGNWGPQPDPNVAARIMQGVVTARPDIANGKGVAGLSIVRHAVGLRPWRKGGLRLKEEKLDDNETLDRA
ncbi:hypothetical protein ACHAPJ_010425 [Fusarium lateritium]